MSVLVGVPADASVRELPGEPPPHAPTTPRRPTTSCAPAGGLPHGRGRATQTPTSRSRNTYVLLLSCPSVYYCIYYYYCYVRMVFWESLAGLLEETAGLACGP